MVHLDERIDTVEQKLKMTRVQNEDCQRLLTIPGIGFLTATALIAAISDITVFKNGRELAAWLGWAWYPDNILPAASRPCWVSASAVTVTLEPY